MKKQTTRRALLLSVLSLVLCVSMLTGTTFAWFTDSVTSANNIIVAGNLDVELYYQVEGQTDWTKVTATTNVFKENTLWEPGHTEVVKLKVVNEGTLALKYQLGVNVASEVGSTNVKGDPFLLSQYIKYGIAADGDYTRDTAIADVATNATALNVAYASEYIELLPADDTATTDVNEKEHIVTLVVYMPTEVGNEANALTTATAPTINLGINVMATQLAYEEDSFGKDYDAEASLLVTNANEFISAIESGKNVTLGADITLENELMIPAGVTLNGNGKQINGTIYAGGDLTIEGHTKVTGFSASYYDRVITIGEGACLEVTGEGRVSLAYGNVFNITGTIENAKTADKASVQPSLIIPAGISITGGNNAVINITNAYVKIGGTSSKNKAANGTFNINITNSIAEFTDQFTFSEPTSGMNPTFNVKVKDSVLTTATKLCIAAPNTNFVIDNSKVILGSYLRNSGKLTLENGSVLTGSTIQFGESGGNNGSITVDNSSLTITATSTGSAFDGKGVGSIDVKNGSTVSVDYYKAMTVTVDGNSSFTGTKVN